MTPDRLERFEANRRRLFGVAYRLLGEASEAEDVVQDAYLRWERGDSAVSPGRRLTATTARARFAFRPAGRRAVRKWPDASRSGSGL